MNRTPGSWVLGTTDTWELRLYVKGHETERIVFLPVSNKAAGFALAAKAKAAEGKVGPAGYDFFREYAGDPLPLDYSPYDISRVIGLFRTRTMSEKVEVKGIPNWGHDRQAPKEELYGRT